MQVFAYCLMPNHVHLVLGPSSSCDIVTFVGQFKNLAQRQVWKLGVTGRIWQESFWDRILREEESLDEIVRYVLHNPVRKGLVERWQDYHFSGSLVYDLGWRVLRSVVRAKGRGTSPRYTAGKRRPFELIQLERRGGGQAPALLRMAI